MLLVGRPCTFHLDSQILQPARHVHCTSGIPASYVRRLSIVQGIQARTCRPELIVALLQVRDLKLGRRTSTVQVSLFQAESENEEVMGYLTNTNLEEESGLSLPTNWSLQPTPTIVDLVRLQNDQDPNWRRITSPFAEFRKATQNVESKLSNHLSSTLLLIEYNSLRA